MQKQLRTVRQIQASGIAFALILADVSFVTWSFDVVTTVQDHPKNVQKIPKWELKGTETQSAAGLVRAPWTALPLTAHLDTLPQIKWWRSPKCD